MRILVTKDNFYEALEDIRGHNFIALDTETTGLRPYQGHRLFSIIISTEEDDYYFNFDDSPDHLGVLAPKETILPLDYLKYFTAIFHDMEAVFMHNAKFDLHILYMSGIEVSCDVICTQATARLLNNQLPNYKLETLGELIGHKKDDTVKKYISKHKLFTLVDVGKKKPRKDLHFDMVPFEIISEYGLTDGRVTYELGMYIIDRIIEINREHEALGLPGSQQVFNNEIQLTKVLFEMEKVVVKLDRTVVKRELQYETDQYLEAAEKINMLTGLEFEDSPTFLKEAFLVMGFTPKKTAKGNDSFSAENLPDNALTEQVLIYRHHYKRAGTYYRNMLDLMDDDDIIHCSFKQSGTTTGRMSCVSPNLQNIPKHSEDEEEAKIREVFIPREGYFLAMIDYDQMEYRLLMDIINEVEIIRMILEEGLDVHTATSLQAAVKRLIAKNINFLAIYGGGPSRLMDYIGSTYADAKRMLANYFSKIKKVKPFMKAISDTAKRRGYIVNPMGRRLLLNKEKPYVMTNHYIQGGCGDICKQAMLDMDLLLDRHESRMLLQVHDEIIFEIKYGEEHILPELKRLMELAYPHKHLPLTAGIDYSENNWHDKKSWSDKNGKTASPNNN